VIRILLIYNSTVQQFN